MPCGTGQPLAAVGIGGTFSLPLQTHSPRTAIRWRQIATRGDQGDLETGGGLRICSEEEERAVALIFMGAWVASLWDFSS
ncbi:hypothetical protein E2562_025543 [Oryza meyeriana var. granulata]|uniref:Uncharacterized protein n=1 Tax=Oryza meyeriana var. granulata TaxID=110450 RepID=A0A6G1FBZ3_9ORYZ|nr:hypothetical protein E2562_025543 [Oryza meyeriana var. granulata]